MTSQGLTAVPARAGCSFGNRAWQVARDELAPFPGRLDMAMRYVLASALIIVVSMTLQVPFLTLSMIAVFFGMQENYALSRMLIIVGVTGVVVAVFASILLLKFTIDYPMLRILGAGLIGFGGVYLLRTSKPLAAAGFLIALAAVYAQSLVDIINDGEALTRLMLWVLAAGIYPAMVVLVVTRLRPSSRPAHQLKGEMGQALDQVVRHLEARQAGKPSTLNLDAIERGVTSRQRLLDFAAMDDPDYVRDRGRHLARIATVERLHLAAARLAPAAPGASGAGPVEPLEGLIRACGELKQDLMRNRPFRLDPDQARELAAAGGQDAALREMAEALEALAEAETAPIPAVPAHREKLFRPDAFSHTAHIKFAVRTVLAALACYVLYTALDWPGIHTAMLTCIILSLPPLGMTSLGGISHKGLVRVLGAVLGSGFALFATVFILPRLDGITGLLAMVLPVIAVAGWITAGSSRSNYVGRQMMFTYVMALLGRFSLYPDLPEIRDRIVGILLGVVIYLTWSTLVWPDREGGALRDLMGRMVRGLGRLARVGWEPVTEVPGLRAVDVSRAECWALLRQSRDLQFRVALEPGLKDAPNLAGLDFHSGFAQVQETLGALHWLQVRQRQLGPDAGPELERELDQFRESAARQLDQIAEQLEGGAGTVPPRPAGSGTRLEAIDALVAAGPVADPNVGEVVAAAHALHEQIVQLDARLLVAAPQPADLP
jgi:multidrug resistance protein MdtO